MHKPFKDRMCQNMLRNNILQIVSNSLSHYDKYMNGRKTSTHFEKYLDCADIVLQ